MDTTQFGQIMEMVGNAGEGAYVVALAYVFRGYFLAMMWVAAVALISRFLFRVIRYLSFTEAVCDVAGVVGEPDRNEKFAIITKLTEARESGWKATKY